MASQRNIICAQCPHCGVEGDVAVGQVGRKVRCPECELTFVVRRERGEAVQTSPGNRGPRRRPVRARGSDDRDDDRGIRRESSGGMVWVIVGSCAGGVLLLGVIATVLILTLSGGSEEDPAVLVRANQNFEAPRREFKVPNEVRVPIRVRRNPQRNKPELPENPIDAALHKIEKGNVFDRSRGMASLLKIAVKPSRRDEIVEVLKKAINTRVHLTDRSLPVKALAKWASAEEVDYLIQLVDDRQHRGVAMQVLADSKDPRAAVAIAKQLTDFFARHEASQALKAMGPKAEKAVLPYLEHRDTHVRIEACRILEVIGTEGSHPVLLKLALSSDGGLAQAARQALPVDKRPPEYGRDERIRLNIRVPNESDWPAIEKRLRGLADSKKFVMCKHHRSGEYMWVTLAPVKVDRKTFARRITFGEVGAIHTNPRLIYIKRVGIK